MTNIEKSARASGLKSPISRPLNAHPEIVNMKRVAVHPAPERDANLKKPKGYETWEVEIEGVGSTEVHVEIPAYIYGMKDEDKRADAIRKLVAKTVKPEADQMLADHAG